MKITRVTRTAGWLAVAGLLGAALIAPAATLASPASYATVTGHEAFSNEANDPGYWGKTCDKYENPEGQSYYVISQNYALIVVKAGSGAYANTLFENVAGGQTVWADTNGNSQFDPGGDGGDKEISHIIYCTPQETTTTTSSTETSETTETSSTETSETTETSSTETSETTETSSTETSETTETSSTETSETTETSSTETSETTETSSTETSETTETSSTETSETTETSSTETTETTDPTPSGTVEAATGTPNVTPPSTDTGSMSSGSGPSGGTWQLLLVAMAGLLATILLLTPATVARKR